MLPVMTALFAFIASFCRSSTSLRLENLALRHQLAVYKQTVPRLSATAWKCAKSGKVKTWHFSGIKFAVDRA